MIKAAARIFVLFFAQGLQKVILRIEQCITTRIEQCIMTRILRAATVGGIKLLTTGLSPGDPMMLVNIWYRRTAVG